MTIQTIIKNTIKRLETEGKHLTPDFYAEAFCKESAKAGLSVEDCSHVAKFTLTLNKEFQNELQKYHIKTMSELARFLISRLNRTNPTHCADLLASQTMFTKRILQAVEILHNKEATELAKKSLVLLNREASISEIDQYRQLWNNYITTYDDKLLEKLNASGSASKIVDSKELYSIASLLVSSFVQSISSQANDKITQISQNIINDPTLLQSSSIEDDIKSVITLRIALDKQSVKRMIVSLDGVLDKLSLRLIEMIENTDNSTIEIQKIKSELEEYNVDNVSNFKVAHRKLYTIATALEENTKVLSKDLKYHNDEVEALGAKVLQLEKDLAEAKENSREDFLTKVYNKRALDELMNIKEAEFERHGHNYSIAFFDLDYFKSVNDNFGHAAGDAVLFAFAKILKSEARNIDIVGRFGGEEFIVILGETDAEGGAVFAQKVRKKVENSRFMYKENRIEVTVSCGVSDRISHASMKSLIKSADENLYKAKQNGRDRVEHK